MKKRGERRPWSEATGDDSARSYRDKKEGETKVKGSTRGKKVLESTGQAGGASLALEDKEPLFSRDSGREHEQQGGIGTRDLKRGGLGFRRILRARKKTAAWVIASRSGEKTLPDRVAQTDKRDAQFSKDLSQVPEKNKEVWRKKGSQAWREERRGGSNPIRDENCAVQSGEGGGCKGRGAACLRLTFLSRAKEKEAVKICYDGGSARHTGGLRRPRW